MDEPLFCGGGGGPADGVGGDIAELIVTTTEEPLLDVDDKVVDDRAVVDIPPRLSRSYKAEVGRWWASLPRCSEKQLVRF